MTPKIKFCGLTRVQDAAAANALLPDYAGFVFAPGSRRFVSDAGAAALRAALDPRIAAVGVFVNDAPDHIAALAAAGAIQIVQLHGQEDAAYLARLRDLVSCPVWQAVRVDGPGDISRANASPADLVVLDHGAGGTGRAFDWSLPAAMTRPFVLAGGLSPRNVADAIRLAHPFGVDTSSGIETNGRKDPAKMAAFAAAVRQFP